MQPFAECSHLTQRRRLKALGAVALAAYGIADAHLTMLAETSTTVFRVDAARQRFALRIHPPQLKTTAAIAEELAWLSALRRETHIAVPEPIATTEGTLV